MIKVEKQKPQAASFSVAIVTATATDTEQIIGLIIPIQTKEFGIRITRADQPDLEDLRRVYQQDKGNFWVAKIGSTVVGTLGLLDMTENNVALRKMFVHQDYRGVQYSIAAKLLARAKEWCVQHEVHSIYLGTIDCYQAAIRFYQKHGFSELNKPELPLTFPVMPVDNRFFSIQLDRD